MNIFFIISVARSGSTAISSICSEAQNCQCEVEPWGITKVMTRQLMDGKLKDPTPWIQKIMRPVVKKKLKKVEVYGEKDPVYAPFIPFFYDVFKCKFIFLTRDGRDVVKSMINWHTQKSGLYYVECKETEILREKAKKNVNKYRKHKMIKYLPDYARPRPLEGDPLYNKWKNLSRLEMCAFYWSKINEICLEGLKNIPENKQLRIDLSSPDPSKKVNKMVDFLGLKGLSKDTIDSFLKGKINSLTYRGHPEGNFPHWSKWNKKTTKKFYNIAGGMMTKLGYV